MSWKSNKEKNEKNEKKNKNVVHYSFFVGRCYAMSQLSCLEDEEFSKRKRKIDGDTDQTIFDNPFKRAKKEEVCKEHQTHDTLDDVENTHSNIPLDPDTAEIEGGSDTAEISSESEANASNTVTRHLFDVSSAESSFIGDRPENQDEFYVDQDYRGNRLLGPPFFPIPTIRRSHGRNPIPSMQDSTPDKTPSPTPPGPFESEMNHCDIPSAEEKFFHRDEETRETITLNNTPSTSETSKDLADYQTNSKDEPHSVGMRPGFGLYFVLDGHGPLGASAASITKQTIVKEANKLLDRHHPMLITQSQVEQLLCEVLNKVQVELTALAERTIEIENQEFGTTCILALLWGANQLTVANIGDSRAVLFRFSSPSPPSDGLADLDTHFYQYRVRQQRQQQRPEGGSAIALSVDHTFSQTELIRIHKAGGRVQEIKKGVRRVLPSSEIDLETIRKCKLALMMSRALGHFILHRFGVSSEPEFSTTTLETGDYLVLASDGLWNFVSNDLALSAFLPLGGTTFVPPTGVAERLLNLTKITSESQGKAMDNTTIVVLRFDAVESISFNAQLLSPKLKRKSTEAIEEEVVDIETEEESEDLLHLSSRHPKPFAQGSAPSLGQHASCRTRKSFGSKIEFRKDEVGSSRIQALRNSKKEKHDGDGDDGENCISPEKGEEEDDDDYVDFPPQKSPKKALANASHPNGNLRLTRSRLRSASDL